MHVHRTIPDLSARARETIRSLSRSIYLHVSVCQLFIFFSSAPNEEMVLYANAIDIDTKCIRQNFQGETRSINNEKCCGTDSNLSKSIIEIAAKMQSSQLSNHKV